MENPTTCKYKTVKYIEKPARKYHYMQSRVVVQNFTEISSPILGVGKYDMLLSVNLMTW